jgi:endonuclease/exonuclease/phosphatase family metal-dependent hydrolase
VRSGRIQDERNLTLTRIPERRRMQWVRLDSGVCVANLHASTRPAKASVEVLAAADAAVEWSGAAPLVFGGDFNLRPARQPEPFVQLRERFELGEPTGPQAIDHILVRGLRVVRPPWQLPAEQRHGLSDHAPVLAEFVR